MNAKRTCGECEHFPNPMWINGECNVPLPKWLDRLEIDSMVYKNTDATHCETFLLKQTRKDDE